MDVWFYWYFLDFTKLSAFLTLKHVPIGNVTNQTKLQSDLIIGLTPSVLSQFYKYHFFTLAQTWVRSYAITSRTKQTVHTKKRTLRIFAMMVQATCTY
jgi:hypothetical protein